MTLNEFMKANGLKLSFSTNGAPWRDLIIYAYLINESGSQASLGSDIVCGEGATEQEATENLVAQITGHTISVINRIEVPGGLE